MEGTSFPHTSKAGTAHGELCKCHRKSSIPPTASTVDLTLLLINSRPNIKRRNKSHEVGSGNVGLINSMYRTGIHSGFPGRTVYKCMLQESPNLWKCDIRRHLRRAVVRNFKRFPLQVAPRLRFETMSVSRILRVQPTIVELSSGLPRTEEHHLFRQGNSSRGFEGVCPGIFGELPPQGPAGAAFKQWTVCPLIQVARNLSAWFNVLYPVGGIAALSTNHGAEENFRGVILYGCYSVRVNNRKSNVRTLSWLEASDYPSSSFLPISTITFKTSFPSSSLVLPAVSKACGTLSRLW